MRKSGGRLRLLLFLVVALFLNSLSPAFAAWTAPVELSATEVSALGPEPPPLLTSSLTVQKDGVAHVVYVEKTGKVYSIIHQTNKTGSWQKETIISSTTRLGSPAAAVYNRQLYLTWTRGTKRASEIIYSTNTGGAWSTSRMTANSTPDISPAIAARRGKVYMSWIEAKRLLPDGSARAGAVRVKTNVSGRWRTETIGDTFFSLGAPVMKVDGGGAAHVVYTGMTKLDGVSLIIHADNAAGVWRQERLPVIDRRGKIVSADMPALALYKNSVYVAFTRDPSMDQIGLAVKKSGVWRLKALTKKAGTMASGMPRIAVGKGRVKVAYTNIKFAAGGVINSEARYLELVHGRSRGETIDSDFITMDPTAATPPPITIFVMTGFDSVQGAVHAVYLRLTVDVVTEKVAIKLLYSRRNPD